MRNEEITELPEIVQEFLTHQKVVLQKSNLTVLEYASDIRSFLRFLIIQNTENNKSFNSIDVSEIDIDLILNVNQKNVYEFIDFCYRVRNNGENTRLRKFSAISTFYKWLASEPHKYISSNPLEHIERPKHKKSLPKYLTLDDSMSLLAHIEGKNKERDYCIIMFFLNCGLRLSELVSINYNDIRSDNSLKIKGKGNKERVVYLNEACIDAYNKYLKIRPVDGVSEKDKYALFLSNQKKRISPKTVQYIVKSLLEKSGLGGQGLSTHKLRHTAATLLYQYADTDVLVLKEMLGHESLSTTEIYTHLSDKQLKTAADKSPFNINMSESKKTDE